MLFELLEINQNSIGRAIARPGSYSTSAATPSLRPHGDASTRPVTLRFASAQTLLQDVLDDPAWGDTLSEADHRGLTALFWAHVQPYGEVHLDMTSRLALRSGSR